jgi:hypothetical protein
MPPSSAAPSEHGDGEADLAEPREASVSTSQAPNYQWNCKSPPFEEEVMAKDSNEVSVDSRTPSLHAVVEDRQKEAVDQARLRHCVSLLTTSPCKLLLGSITV